MTDNLYSDTEEVELKPCPHCGSEAKSKGMNCRVGFRVICRRCGANIRKLDPRKDVVAAWNRRTPEPGASVVRWIRYDGTPRTLPDEAELVLVYRLLTNNLRYRYTMCFIASYMFARNKGAVWLVNDKFSLIECCGLEKIHIGDIWAYLPVLPKFMDNLKRGQHGNQQ